MSLARIVTSACLARLDAALAVCSVPVPGVGRDFSGHRACHRVV